MPKRIESREEAISGTENAQQYAEMAKKSAKMMYGSFLKHIKSLDPKGGNISRLVRDPASWLP